MNIPFWEETYQNDNIFTFGPAKDGEIKELYSDWDIISFKTYVFEDEHPNVPKHLHASNKIIARRIK